MEEKKVIIGIVGTIIGLLVLGAGLYYLKKENYYSMDIYHI